MDKYLLNHVISELDRNQAVFERQLEGLSKNVYLHREGESKWCILEVLCHLRDEEKEDFKARMKVILDIPSSKFKPIDPPAWAIDRKYTKQNYNEVLDDFLAERNYSIEWLRTLEKVRWDNVYEHPYFGKMTAELFLSNWLAHDYIHIRQINRIKRSYFKLIAQVELNYAGDW